MLVKYLAILVGCLNYSLGEQSFLNTSATQPNQEINAWETEIEKVVTVKLKNKIEENLEKRLEEKLGKLLEELFKQKLKGVHSCCNRGKQEPMAWIQTTPRAALSMSDCAVIAGYEGHDRSPLWVIRARHEGNLIPGKLAVNHRTAFVASDGIENPVDDIEVFCTSPEKVKWVTSHGFIPPNAIIAGYMSTGLPLYIGRAKEGKSLTPGMIHPERKTLLISFAGKEIEHKTYEILCLA